MLRIITGCSCRVVLLIWRRFLIKFKICKAIAGQENEVVHVNIQTWKTTYKGIIDDAFLDAPNEKSEKRLSKTQKDIAEGKIYVVLSSGKVVGIAIYGNARDDKYANYGEIYAIYVLNEYQNVGIGRALVNTVKKRFLSKRI